MKNKNHIVSCLFLRIRIIGRVMIGETEVYLLSIHTPTEQAFFGRFVVMMSLFDVL
jgi:hypothetical protein